MKQDHIQTLYRTPAGSLWETHYEAEIAHRLESTALYLETWRMKAIVEAICGNTETETSKDTDNEAI